MRHTQHFVEELTRRHETPVGRVVAIAALRPNPHQPRASMGDLSDLVDSIQVHGVLEPILVRRIGRNEAADVAVKAGEPTLEIISGERRYRAALAGGLIEVPVVEMDVNDEQALEIALVENLQRKDLTPFEEADGYRQLLEQFSYGHERIAEVIGKARSTITESLMLLQLPTKVREAAEALGIRTKSTLLGVLKAPGEEEMIQLLERIARHGLSRDDVRRERKSLEQSRRKLGRRRPYIFKFRAPDKTYSLSLAFRQSTVERDDLIRALEQILLELRNNESE